MGISSERVVLVGFSQGGAVVLEAALGQDSEVGPWELCGGGCNFFGGKCMKKMDIIFM